MKNVRFEELRAVRPRLAASAAALAVVGAAGILAASGSAAPEPLANRAPEQHKLAEVNEPKLENGLLTVEGTGAGDRLARRLQAGQPGTIEVDFGDDGTADFSFARADISEIAVDAKGGDDSVRIDDGNGSFTDSIPTTLDGEGGDDRLAGGAGAETLLGRGGRDSIDGNRGNDVAVMGGGDDTFVWDPGDGSDVVEGQGGHDTMLFNGANITEQVDLSANGKRLLFFRNPGPITMDTDGVERVDFNALGGADVVTVNDLSGTDVDEVNVDLAAVDKQADRVVVKGTDGDDEIDVSGDAGEVKVSGLAATVRALHPEPAQDQLAIDTLAGNDAVDAAGLAAGAIQLFVDGILLP